jgi:hypothetical protein
MPQSIKSHAPVPTCDIDAETLAELLQDTALLAAQEGAAASCESFVDYISEALPTDMLQQLAQLMGAGSQEGDSVRCLLQELWEDRYAPADEEAEEHCDDTPIHCQVCERCVPLTRHHLFPRETHKFCLKRKLATAEELEHRVLLCCRLCHNAIHRFFSNEDLAAQFNTLEKLLSDQKFFRFAKWNAAQSAGRNGKCR